MKRSHPVQIEEYLPDYLHKLRKTGVAAYIQVGRACFVIAAGHFEFEEVVIAE
jgi:hypothetical protein